MAVGSSASKDLVPEATLSKSKKKRLKRRLKTLSLSTNSPHPEGISTEVNKLAEPTVGPSNATPILSKAGLIKMDKKENNKHIEKQNKVADTVDGEILPSGVKIGREQLLSERGARKKAKQLAKQQKREGTSTADQTLLKNQNLDQKGDSILKCVINEASNDIKEDLKSINSKEVKSVLKKYESRVEIKSFKSGDLNTNSCNDSCVQALPSQNVDIEKSREEVLAEREAKKKAKQLAKLKKGGKMNEKNEPPINIEDCKRSDDLKTGGSNNQNNLTEVKPISTDTMHAISSNKSKAELRAERRAKQEAQRAAKEAEKKLKSESAENKENKIVSQAVKKSSFHEKESVREIKGPGKTKIVSQQRIKLFSHLHIGEKPAFAQINQTVHPSVVELGVKYSARIINGSNARCVALLNCLKEVITDYTTPSEKEFSRGLESKLGELANYINHCRPMSVSMTNALRHIKSHLTQLPNNVSDTEAKRKLVDVIDTFIREQIDVAGEAICESVKNKIANGDVILIYSCSSLLYRILTESHRSGREFSVVVVDGGPWFEGREMLRRLVSAGLKCTYVQVSAINFIMRQATKVLLGAHALLANGSVMSRAGAAIVALSAHSYNVPVLVCCETYKFCERVQTDAFVYNELGSPDDLAQEDESLINWQTLNFLSPLSLVYDITPPDLVTAVVTEIAILPCTSVPVILRVKPSDVVS